jgi:hypothetical protein
VVAECELIGRNMVFRLRDLDPTYHAAARDLGFAVTENDFTRTRAFVAATPDLPRICANFRRHAASMLRQTARTELVPWESALRLWLKRLEGHRVDWFLCGSAALAVRSIPVIPRDIDIVTDDVGALKLGEIFADYLVEPVAPIEGWICNWFGRAFLEARFEWVGGVHSQVDTPSLSDFGPAAERQLEVISWNGYELRLPPLELQLAVCERRGLTDRAEAIRNLLKT